MASENTRSDAASGNLVVYTAMQRKYSNEFLSEKWEEFQKRDNQQFSFEEILILEEAMARGIAIGGHGDPVVAVEKKKKKRKRRKKKKTEEQDWTVPDYSAQPKRTVRRRPLIMVEFNKVCKYLGVSKNLAMSKEAREMFGLAGDKIPRIIMDFIKTEWHKTGDEYVLSWEWFGKLLRMATHSDKVVDKFRANYKLKHEDA